MHPVLNVSEVDVGYLVSTLEQHRGVDDDFLGRMIMADEISLHYVHPETSVDSLKIQSLVFNEKIDGNCVLECKRCPACNFHIT